MNAREGTISLSATDLANHLSCRHLTVLNLFAAKGDLPAPDWEDPHLRVLQQRGMEHEKAYIDHLRSRGLTIVDLSGEAGAVAEAAMRSGADVIVQASFASWEWRGRTDVLLRVERPSDLGDWSYEVVDCKLAQDTKAETMLQLCLYSEFVGEIQNLAPEYFHVVRPNVDFAPESYRLSLFGAYYRFVKSDLRNAVLNIQSVRENYPEPVSHCDICRWWKRCDQQRRQDDHLCFVAGASRLQRKELVLHGVSTLEGLAKLPLPIPFNPSRGSREGYTRIREQARVQFEARIENGPRFEMLQVEPNRGLCQLPSASLGDIFLDFEGDPFVEDGGLEYLLGVATMNDKGELVYQYRWALDRVQERATLEWFIDFVFERMVRFPDLHIYHFGIYEPAAIKRLMFRYATREDQVDRLLRGGIFIDLHTVVRQAVRASVEQYSLKDLEKFCLYQRNVPLPDASKARHFIEHQLELSRSPTIEDEASVVVQRYNEDDCRATERLRTWLENIRANIVSNGTDIPRPEAKESDPTEAVSAHQQRVAALFAALTSDLPVQPELRSPEQSARWLLAHGLDWHRREEKVKWWEFFRLKDIPEDELYDEKSAVAGLSHRQRLPKTSPRERNPIDQYHYPPQEFAINQGDTLYSLDENRFGDVLAVDLVARTIDVKKPIKLDGFHPKSVFAHTRYPTDEQTESILRLAEWIVANGIDSPGDYRAARDLLLRKPPRFSAGESLMLSPNETVLQAACRLGSRLDNSLLPIQGPPGTGKTFAGARMICELVRQGKKVGITAVTHNAIRQLLDKVVSAAQLLNIGGVVCAHRKNEVDGYSGPIQEIRTNEEALDVLRSNTANVLGGTAWLWTRQDFFESVDVLFVDEAGQMSLANVLACAPAGKNLVLLGDPQQLEQPQKGSHPEGSDVSALSHLLAGKKTIDATHGLFLAETRRLHPEICRFTSEMFYEERLKPIAGLERQKIDGFPPFSGAGLWFVPVHHDGNQSYSPEEVEQVAAIVERLLRAEAGWIDRDGDRRLLTLSQILIVAPYNAQVNRLNERLPGANVGTVDRFQGQEAPLAIYSMTTSTPEDAPRGMEFLYDLNRFNVATSRAQCSCIVVANPRLFQPACHTPRQIELANVLCRYSEVSRKIKLGTPAFGTLPI